MNPEAASAKLEQLRTKLRTVTTQVARMAVRRFGADGLYSFALYSDNELRYVFATVSTMSGLKAAAARYMANPRFSQKWGSLDEAMRQLKWSPCDSPYHTVFSDDYEAVDEMLGHMAENAQNDSEESFFETVAQIEAIFFDTLREIRSSGIFSEEIVLNVLTGDQSNEERIENATELNSPEVVALYRSELVAPA